MTADLSTEYLGLGLKNPLIISACPLSEKLDSLKRLEDGDYGCCVKCDEEISEKRLAADPATPFCVRCAGGRRAP